MKNSLQLIALATLFAAATSQAQCLSDAQVEHPVVEAVQD